MHNGTDMTVTKHTLSQRLLNYNFSYQKTNVNITSLTERFVLAWLSNTKIKPMERIRSTVWMAM